MKEDFLCVFVALCFYHFSYIVDFWYNLGEKAEDTKILRFLS